ncbi:MAG: hypothetical protein KDK26_06720 [Roseivivax sp.]|nr:hypothetical protein [Roseivivax sp.]
MILIYTLMGVYALVAAGAVAMTLREQSAAPNTVTMADRVLGVLACFLWPLSFVAVAVAVQRRSPTAVRSD